MSTPTHYAIAAEIGRQRREHIAASFAASRRMPDGRPRGRRSSFPRRRVSTAVPTAAATSHSPATA